MSHSSEEPCSSAAAGGAASEGTSSAGCLGLACNREAPTHQVVMMRAGPSEALDVVKLQAANESALPYHSWPAELHAESCSASHRSLIFRKSLQAAGQPQYMYRLS